MREIQTEIRRDRIENDNRKNELQSKAHSGLKTAERDTETEQEKTQTISESSEQEKRQAAKTPQAENNIIHTAWKSQRAVVMHEPNVQQASSSEPSNSFKGEAADSEVNQTVTEYTAPKASEATPTTQRNTSNREIQNQIKHDNIENSVKHDAIQNKAQSGLKTAKTNTENKQENTQTINRSSEQDKQHTTKTVQQASSSEFSNSYKGEEADSEPTQTAAESTVPETSETAPTTQKDTANGEIQNQVKSDNVESSVKHNVIQNKAESGIKTKKGKFSKVKENAKVRIAEAFKTAATVGVAASEMLESSVPNESDDLSSESANEIKKTVFVVSAKSLEAVKRISDKKVQPSKSKKHNNQFAERIKKNIKANVKKVKVKVAEKISNSAAANKIRRIKKEIHKAKVKIVDKINNTAVVKKVKEVKNKAVDVTKKIKDKVKKVKKKTVRRIIKVKRKILKAISVRRIFDKSGALSEKNVKRLRNTITRAKTRKVNRKKRLRKIVTKVKAKVKAFAKKAKSYDEATKKALRKSKGAISNGVAGTVGAVSKIKSLSSSDDTGNDLAQLSKDIAAKSAELSYNAVKTVIKKPAKAVTKRIKSEKTRTVKTAVNNVRKTRRIHKSVKSTVKTTKKTAKKAEKAAKTTAKATAKTTDAAAKIGAKIVSGIANSVGALMSTPAGPIILVIIAVVVVIVLIFNIVSGAIQVPVSMVSGIGSSLSWLFGGDDSEDHSNDDIADLYNEFEQKARSAMQSARTYYINEINGISFDERDSVEFNGASYYPASFAVQNYVGAYLFNYLNSYGDYPYLMQLCYIIKLRDERAAQGLSEDDMPEVTIEESDILSFIINYCYEFEITVKLHQSCPTSDCRTVTWYHPDGFCPDVSEDEACVGHLYYFCDGSHKKVIINFQKVSKEVLENDVLMLTDTEKSMLETGISLITDSLQP